MSASPIITRGLGKQSEDDKGVGRLVTLGYGGKWYPITHKHRFFEACPNCGASIDRMYESFDAFHGAILRCKDCYAHFVVENGRLVRVN